MAPRIGIRLTLAAVLAASVACTMTISSPSFAATPSGDSLIAVDPIPGFTVDSGAKLSGPIDSGTLFELTGVEPGKVPEALREIKGQARTWRAADGSVVIVMVMVGDDELSASIMLRRVVNESKKSTDESFDVGLRGMVGFNVKQADVHISSVIWRQSNYLVEVLAAGDVADTSITNVKLLAASQAAVLTSLDRGRTNARRSAIGSGLGGGFERRISTWPTDRSRAPRRPGPPTDSAQPSASG